jgi:proteasome lid subunit RPN8/RPN11
MNQPSLIPGLNRRVRSEIYDHIFANDDHEVGGVLVGSLGSGDLPAITAAIPALEADGQRASVTFTHEAWSEIHEKLDRDYPDRQIVGWYHSHPGFGIFLSEHDRFIHANFFSDARQVAYVVDPHAGTEGVFTWQSGELRLLEERPTDRPGTGPGGRQGGERAKPGGVRLKPPLRWQYGALALLVVATAAVIVAIGTGGSVPAVSPSLKVKSTVTAITPGSTHPTRRGVGATGATGAASAQQSASGSHGSTAVSATGAGAVTASPDATGSTGSTGAIASG